MGRGFDRILVHFQPALYYRPRRPLSKVITSLSLLWLAVRRSQLDVLVHEADPPARWRPDYALLGLAFARAGRVSFHTQAERDALEGGYRVTVRGSLIRHRVASVLPDPVPKEQARQQLGLGGTGPVFVCAGFLQPSKGFDRAVAAFGRTNGRGAGALYVVGSVRDHTRENDAYLAELRDACRRTDRAELVEKFLSDEEFDLWVAAADWVVLPYRQSWSSGVLARAHALGTVAMVADVGGLAQQARGRDVVFDGDDGLAEALASASAEPSRERFAADRDVSPELADWDPEFQPPLPKKGRGMLFGLILVSVVLAAAAQLTLKHGMTQVTNRGALPLDLKAPVDTARRVASNAAVVAGLLTFVVSAAVWILVLSRVSLSFAYPFVSLTYVIILLFDGLVLHEQVSSLRWAGVAFIIAGILLVSRTHQSA